MDAGETASLALSKDTSTSKARWLTYWVFYGCLETSQTWLDTRGKMHETLCAHKERNMHSHSFCQIYKAVRALDSVFFFVCILLIVEMGICAQA